MALCPRQSQSIRHLLDTALRRPDEHPQLVALIIRNNIVRSIPSPPDTAELSHALQAMAQRLQAFEERLASLEEFRQRRLDKMQRQIDGIAALIAHSLTARQVKRKNVHYAQV